MVTGLGAITPLGASLDSTWSRLLAGYCGITRLKARPPEEQWKGLTSTVAGLVPHEGESPWRPSQWFTPYEQRSMSQFTQYALVAAQMALEQSGWRPTNQSDLESTGVCVGSGIGNLEALYDTSLDYQAGGYKKVSPLFVPKILINLAAGQISLKYGFRGPNHCVTTACTTGAHSIGDASRFISFGDADVMVAGGTESCIHPLTFAGFGRSRSLSTAFNDAPSSASRPFDARRNGFVVSEGSAVVILEELEHARSRGAKILAEMKGYGCSGDAYHVTAPREDGTGALLAMTRALKSAGLKPRAVDYINAHATGTTVGDIAEAKAISSLMLGQDGVQNEHQVTVSSTKGAVGHLLGGAGAIEAIFCILAVANDVVPPTLNLDVPDVGTGFNFVRNQAQEKRVRVAMSNSFGFGGTNSSLVFVKCEQ